MVRTRKQARRPALKTKPRRKLRRRINKSNNTRRSTTTSIGTIVTKGIRSVLAALPFGKATTSIADFIFSVMGYSEEAISATPGAASTATILATGLSGAFGVDPTVLLGSSHECGIVTPSPTGNPDVVSVVTQWSTARISLLKIVARPSGPIGTVSGTWGIGLIPIRTAATLTSVVKQIKEQGITFEAIRQCPLNAFGDANKPLQLRKYFTPADGLAYQPASLETDSTSALVLVAYQDLMRGTYTEPKETDFQCTIDVSGTVVLSERLPLSPVQTFDNKVNNLGLPLAVVRHPNGIVGFGSKTTCKGERGLCTISGVVDSVVKFKSFGKELSLESLAMDC